jgi:hypothetical protein
MELVRNMIHSQNVPSKFWGEATQIAVYVLNCTLSRNLDRTPYESWFHVKPSLSHLLTFGCSTYIYAEKHTRSKLDPKSCFGLFMGYSDTSKAYRIWDFSKDKIVITHDVLFHETKTALSPASISPSPSLPVPVIVYFPNSPLIPSPLSLSSPVPLPSSSSSSSPVPPCSSDPPPSLAPSIPSFTSVPSSSSDSLNPKIHTLALSLISFTTQLILLPKLTFKGGLTSLHLLAPLASPKPLFATVTGPFSLPSLMIPSSNSKPLPRLCPVRIAINGLLQCRMSIPHCSKITLGN